MKKRIVSKYPYPTKYEGGLLHLSPGTTLVEESLWTEAKKASSRLRAQLDQAQVVDEGRYADWFITQVKKGPVEADDVNALSPEEAQVVVAKVKDKEQLSDLLSKAERGGIKGVFRAALASKKEA